MEVKQKQQLFKGKPKKKKKKGTRLEYNHIPLFNSAINSTRIILMNINLIK